MPADPNRGGAQDGLDRLIARYGEGFADAIIENVPEGDETREAPIDDRSFLAAVAAGYYSSDPFDPELLAAYELASGKPPLAGERYLKILKIDETEYQRLIDRPVVVPKPEG